MSQNENILELAIISVLNSMIFHLHQGGDSADEASGGQSERIPGSSPSSLCDLV